MQCETIPSYTLYSLNCFTEQQCRWKTTSKIESVQVTKAVKMKFDKEERQRDMQRQRTLRKPKQKKQCNKSAEETDPAVRQIELIRQAEP